MLPPALGAALHSRRPGSASTTIAKRITSLADARQIGREGTSR
jgi:hypothetical protein